MAHFAAALELALERCGVSQRGLAIHLAGTDPDGRQPKTWENRIVAWKKAEATPEPADLARVVAAFDPKTRLRLDRAWHLDNTDPASLPDTGDEDFAGALAALLNPRGARVELARRLGELGGLDRSAKSWQNRLADWTNGHSLPTEQELSWLLRAVQDRELARRLRVAWDDAQPDAHPPAPGVVIGSAPPLASAYRPRAVADELRGPGCYVLSGDGGVGKSQLAAGLFHRSRDELRIWVVANSQARLVAGLAEAARRLHLIDPESPPDEQARALLGYLAALPTGWLLVLDDLTDPADLNTWAVSGAGRVVVTTRRRDARLSGGGRVLVDVDAFTHAEARGYLDSRFEHHRVRLPLNVLLSADELVEDLGRLPLALSHAAAVIIDGGLTCADYRVMFADRAAGLDRLLPPTADGDGYARTVATTWQLAMEAADRLEPVGLASRMARFVAVTDPTGTPTAVFLAAAVTGELAPGRAPDPELGEGALRALATMSLISFSTAGSGPQVRMHRLTGRGVLHAADAPLTGYLVQTVARALVAEVWPIQPGDGPLLAALRGTVAHLHQVDAGALWQDEDGRALLVHVARSMAEYGLAEECVTYTRDRLAEARRFVLPLDIQTLWELEAGQALLKSGRAEEALRVFEALREKPSFQLGGVGRDVIDVRYAQALADLGRVAEALAVQEGVVRGRGRPWRGGRTEEQLQALVNLAIYHRQNGEIDRAVALYQEVLQEISEDHPEYDTVRSNLAVAYQKLGRPGEALPLLISVVVRAESTLGPDHPSTLHARNNLAGATKAAGDLPGALSLYREVLERRVRVLGPDHPETLNTQNNVAACYHAMGDDLKAYPLAMATLESRVRVLGETHPLTLNSKASLASVLLKLDVRRARDLLEETVTAEAATVGLDNQVALMHGHQFGIALADCGELERSVQVLTDVATRLHRLLGPDNPQTLITRFVLHEMREHAGLGPDGERRRIHDHAARVLGPTHEMTRMMAEGLGL